ncbi:hypothetical protein [Azospirillum sp. TSO35-2]|uniref:hypothetical protein n=1 Tax=Azospirillum sp. TSO35-2 TaxID=716796 RepID=UPI0011B56934|nr:hypothetical protein [Azospirillum sp. TSO35-2]
MITTTSIADAAAANLHAAIAFAAGIGTPLNEFVTVDWGLADLTPSLERPLHHQGRMLERAAKWLGRRRVPLAYVWVLERVTGSVPHSHILIHVPPEHIAAFRVKLRRDWTGAGRRPGLVACRQIYNPEGIEAYLLKGTDPEAAAALGIVARPQGAITGKRSGTSESLGRAARDRYATATAIRAMQQAVAA